LGGPEKPDANGAHKKNDNGGNGAPRGECKREGRKGTEVKDFQLGRVASPSERAKAVPETSAEWGGCDSARPILRRNAGRKGEKSGKKLNHNNDRPQWHPKKGAGIGEKQNGCLKGRRKKGDRGKY